MKLDRNLKHYVAAGTVLFLAGYLRLAQMDLMEFKQDEAVASVLVAQAVEGGEFPTHGLMSSVGVYNPPVFIYLLLLPGLLSTHPIHLTQFVALLNILAVALCYRFGRRIFNPWVGLTSALLFAVAPWALVFSRKLWAQDCLPFFSVLVLGGLYELCQHGNRSWFIPVALCAGLMPGIHFSGFFGTVVVALVVVIFRPQIGAWRWGVVTAVLLAVYLPYALTAGGSGRLAEEWSASHFSFISWVYAVQILSHFDLGELLGSSLGTLRQALPLPVSILGEAGGLLTVTLFVAGFFWLSGSLFRRWSWKEPLRGLRQNPGRTLCWLWVTLPLLAYPLLSMDEYVYRHYLIILYPVPFWLAAFGADRLGSQGTKGWRVVVATGIAVVVLLESLVSIQLLRLLDGSGGASGEYGVIYRHKEAAARFIAHTCLGQETIPTLHSPSGDSLLEYQYLVVLEANKPGVLGRENAQPSEAVIVTERELPPGYRIPSSARKQRFGPVEVICF